MVRENAGENSFSTADQRPAQLAWQSRAVLLLVVPAAGVYAALLFVDVPSLHLLATAAAWSVALAVAVVLARAATVPAALLGALLAFCYGLTPGSPHSPLWLLFCTLVLTLGASRVGKTRKRVLALELGLGEEHSGRTAAQVAANLGVGALAGALSNTEGALVAHTVMLAALAEATADTLASELGQLAAAAPRMLLTGRRVAPGTDGAVSVLGTVAAAAGAALLGLLAVWAFALPWWAAGLGAGAGVFGLLFDSLLGQLVEQRGLLNNDAVNFLSTLASAALAWELASLTIA
jgi:uncharacterized protein (TIGR00297 family)